VETGSLTKTDRRHEMIGTTRLSSSSAKPQRNAFLPGKRFETGIWRADPCQDAAPLQRRRPCAQASPFFSGALGFRMTKRFLINIQW